MNENKKETVHPKTAWKFIKDDIEFKIIKGELKNADKVPSIAELATLYNVCKSTTQKTLEDMCSEGTIMKRKGVGYFVIPYTKEKLRVKHKRELVNMFENCLAYADKLGMSRGDLEEIKEIINKTLK